MIVGWFGKRPVVDSYDPATWIWPREEEYEQEWRDATEETEMNPYLCVAFVKPTTKEEEDGAEPKLLTLAGQPFAVVLAEDESNAKMKVAALLKEVPARLEVRVLPFTR